METKVVKPNSDEFNSVILVSQTITPPTYQDTPPTYQDMGELRTPHNKLNPKVVRFEIANAKLCKKELAALDKVMKVLDDKDLLNLSNINPTLLMSKDAAGKSIIEQLASLVDTAEVVSPKASTDEARIKEILAQGIKLEGQFSELISRLPELTSELTSELTQSLRKANKSLNEQEGLFSVIKRLGSHDVEPPKVFSARASTDTVQDSVNQQPQVNPVIEKRELLKQLLVELAYPLTTTQDKHGTCVAEVMSNMFFKQAPGKWTSMVIDLANRSNKLLTLPKDIDETDSSRERSPVARLVQSGILNTFAAVGYTYDNSTDKYYDKDGNCAASGLYTCEAATGLTKLLGIKHSKIEDKAILKALLEAEKLEFVTLDWDGDSHAVMVTEVKDGRVFFRNPHGPCNARQGDKISEDGPLRRVEDSTIGIQSMPKDDFLKILETAAVPTTILKEPEIISALCRTSEGAEALFKLRNPDCAGFPTTEMIKYVLDISFKKGAPKEDFLYNLHLLNRDKENFFKKIPEILKWPVIDSSDNLSQLIFSTAVTFLDTNYPGNKPSDGLKNVLISGLSSNDAKIRAYALYGLKELPYYKERFNEYSFEKPPFDLTDLTVPKRSQIAWSFGAAISGLRSALGLARQ
jgi:hypothetical protein